MIERKNGSGNQAKVLIVDDHPVVRYGISKVISSEKDMVVCGEAYDDISMMKVINDNKPDIVLMDITLGNVDGFTLLKMLNSTMPKLPVLIVTMHDEVVYAKKAIKLGARGYVMKANTVNELVTAIRSILSGELYLSEEVKEDVIRNYANCYRQADEPVVEMLSNRERQIFIMIGEGYSARTIAAKLGLSIKTVDTHRSRIKVKMGIKTMSGLMHSAVKWVEKKGITPSARVV